MHILIDSSTTPKMYEEEPPSGLLEQDVENRILGDFPLSVRRPIIAALVGHIVATKNPQSYLKTRSHINWVMEVIGQGLALPTEDHDLINNCIGIYRQWVQVYKEPSDEIPLDLIADPEPFLKIIYVHLTLVFNPAKQFPMGVGQENNKYQIMLCQIVLEILQNHGKDSGWKFTNEMWEVLLKSLLGVAHNLLRPPAKAGSMADQLCPNLLRVLSLCATWLHRMPLVLQWNATCLALTNRVLNLLYGPTEGASAIILGRGSLAHANFKDLSYGVTIDMPDACAVQCWHRMLHIIGNPTQIQSGMIFKYAMEGVANMVDCFLGVGRNVDKAIPCDMEMLVDELMTGTRKARPPTPTKPSSNSLLHIFGHWLFDATYTNFEEGRAQALGALCRIFSSQQGHTWQTMIQSTNDRLWRCKEWIINWLAGTGSEKFLPQYLARFYTVISEGLNRDGAALTEIIINSTTLFARELEGCRVLVVPFISALEKVLSVDTAPQGFHYMPYSELRHAAIEVLISLFSLPNHFGQLEALSCMRDDLLAMGKPLMNLESHSNSKPELTRDADMELNLNLAHAQNLPTFVRVRPKSRKLSDAALRKSASFPLEFEEPDSPDCETDDLMHSFSSDVTFTPAEAGSLDAKLADMMGGNGRRQYTSDRSSTVCDDWVHGSKATFDQLENPTSQTSVLDSSGHGPLPKAKSFSTGTQRPSRPNRTAGISNTRPRSMIQEIMSSSSMRWRVSEDGKTSQRRSFWEMKNRLSHLLIKAFECEVDPNNTQMLLYAIAVYVCEDADYTQTLPHRALRSIQRQLIRLSWSTDVTQTAFEVLSGLVNVREIVRPQDLVLCLYDYIIKQASQPPYKHTTDLHTKIAGAYRCLQTWVTTDQWIIDNRETLSKVMEVIELGITGTRSRDREYMDQFPESKGMPKEDKMYDPKPPSARMKDAAEQVLANLLHHLGNFPPKCGPESMSSLEYESSLIKELEAHGVEDPRSYMRYFGIDGEIIMCICEMPFEEGGPGVAVILRDMYGTFTFHTKITYTTDDLLIKPQSQAELRPKPLTTNAEMGVDTCPTNDEGPSLADTPTYTTNQSSSISRTFTQSNCGSYKLFEDFLKEQMKTEKEIHESLSEAASHVAFPDESTALDVPEYKDKYTPGISKFQIGRQLAAHLGLLSLDNLSCGKDKRERRRVVQLVQDKRLLCQLMVLDEMPERDTDVFSVLYVPKGCSEPEKIVGYQAPNLIGSDFEAFLYSLGWALDVTKHNKWPKVMPRPEQCASLPYYADLVSEVLFYVPALIRDGVHNPNVTQVRARSSSANCATNFSGSSEHFADARLRQTTPDQSSGSHPKALRSRSGLTDISHLMSPNNHRRAAKATVGYGYADIDHSPLDSEEGISDNRGGNVIDDVIEKIEILSNHAVTIVWLVDFDDHHFFPFKDEKKTILYVHPLQIGLYRIRVESKVQEGPLIEGMVVSRKVLGKMVRQTALNSVRRRRATADVTTRPHNLRKKQIDEILVMKDQSISAFYAGLLADKTYVQSAYKAANLRRFERA